MKTARLDRTNISATSCVLACGLTGEDNSLFTWPVCPVHVSHCLLVFKGTPLLRQVFTFPVMVTCR